MLNEIIQRKTSTVYYHLCVKSKKNYNNKEMHITKQRQTHRYRKQTNGYQKGERR